MKFPNRRITPTDLEDFILSEHYINAGDTVTTVIPMQSAVSLGLLTICVLVLKNGFTVTGKSACAFPENYNREIGEQIARNNAVEEIWPLLGFMLRDELHEQEVQAR